MYTTALAKLPSSPTTMDSFIGFLSMQNWSLVTTSGLGLGGTPSTTNRPLSEPHSAAEDDAVNERTNAAATNVVKIFSTRSITVYLVNG